MSWFYTAELTGLMEAAEHVVRMSQLVVIYGDLSVEVVAYCFILSLAGPYIGRKWDADLKEVLTWYTLFNILNELAYEVQYLHQSGSYYIRDYSVLI